jgi:hypothetical protein
MERMVLTEQLVQQEQSEQLVLQDRTELTEQMVLTE